MKRLTILITMLMATSGWAYNESDIIKLKTIYECMNCDLSGLDFTNIPGYTPREEPYLKEINLSGANLSGANLSGANFTKAFLTSAKLSEADLDGVVLVRTNLNYADLSNADFTKAKSMSRIVLDDAKYCNTTMRWGVLNDGC